MAPVPVSAPNGESPVDTKLAAPAKGEKSTRLHSQAVIIGSGPAGHTAGKWAALFSIPPSFLVLSLLGQHRSFRMLTVALPSSSHLSRTC